MINFGFNMIHFFGVVIRIYGIFYSFIQKFVN